MTARVLLDSVAPSGVRVTTIEVTMHRFVLAEFNTHRVFSRNSASSRAIPFERALERANASPVSWPSRQRGMQGGPPLDGDAAHAAQVAWDNARHEAVESARRLHALGVHKSVTNRLIEPFAWHTVIVTATEWDGFWEQRCSPLAQPEIRVAAEAMKAAYDASEPTELGPGEWHTPLIQPDEDDAFWHHEMTQAWERNEGSEFSPMTLAAGSPVELRKAVSAARCARVSYLTHDGQRDVTKDLDLYARLVTADPGHWSPFEHVATPCPAHARPVHAHRGNLRGWDQMRHEVER